MWYCCSRSRSCIWFHVLTSCREEKMKKLGSVTSHRVCGRFACLQVDMVAVSGSFGGTRWQIAGAYDESFGIVIWNTCNVGKISVGYITCLRFSCPCVCVCRYVWIFLYRIGVLYTCGYNCLQSAFELFFLLIVTEYPCAVVHFSCGGLPLGRGFCTLQVRVVVANFISGFCCWLYGVAYTWDTAVSVRRAAATGPWMMMSHFSFKVRT